MYSHCLLCPLSYIDEATTPLSIRICILSYPWLALGEQSEGGLISMVGYLSIFASSSSRTNLLWRACMQDIFTMRQTLLFISTRAGPAWLGWAREGLLGPSRAFTRTFTFRRGTHGIEGHGRYQLRNSCEHRNDTIRLLRECRTSNFRFLHYRALHCIAAVCKLICDLSSGHLPIHDVCRDTGRDLHHIFLVG